jgi:hypothetical protein
MLRGRDYDIEIPFNITTKYVESRAVFKSPHDFLKARTSFLIVRAFKNRAGF